MGERKHQCHPDQVRELGTPGEATGMKPTGWYQQYQCGCLSVAFKHKVDLPGRCVICDHPVREVLPIF